jgi:hypothetical protein
VGISPGEGVLVFCAGPFGAGEEEPLVGISPAKADIERTQANIVAVKNRLIFVFSFED